MANQTRPRHDDGVDLRGTSRAKADLTFSYKSPQNTHLPDPDFGHADLDQLKIDIVNAVGAVTRQHAKQYAKAHVLMLRWDENDIDGITTEMEELQTLFETQFEYTTEIALLPTEGDPTTFLQDKLQSTKGDLKGSNNLLMIYYSGHGVKNNDSNSIWCAWNNDTAKRKREENPASNWKSPTLSWDCLQWTLAKDPCDIVMILDCCYAGTAANLLYIDSTSIRELLAACGKESLADSGRLSFTNNLQRAIEEFLKNQPSKPFSIYDIWFKLLTEHFRYLPATPHHLPLSGRDRPSIMLTPKSANDGNLENSSPTLNNPGKLRVLIAITIELDKLNAGLWQEWPTTGIPKELSDADVQVEAIFQGRSTVLLLSIPTHFWAHLADKSEYRFVDFIRSGNLLSDTSAASGKDSSRHSPSPSRPGSSQRGLSQSPVLSEATSASEGPAQTTDGGASYRHARSESI